MAMLDEVPWGTPPVYTTINLRAGSGYPIEIEAKGSPQLDPAIALEARRMLFCQLESGGVRRRCHHRCGRINFGPLRGGKLS